MNNIEILEMQLKKIKDFCKDNNHYYPEDLPYYMFWNGKQAEIVENLIKENKELKEKMNFIHINNLNDIYEETLEKTFKKYIDKDIIPISKIQNRITELEELLQSTIIKDDYKKEVQARIYELKDLLKEE